MAMPLLLISGCDSSNPGDDGNFMALNLVTYQGTAPNGVTTLTYRELDDSPLVTLTCDWTPDRELAPGTRLVIMYTTDTPNQSGHVTLRQAALTYGGALEWADNAPDMSTSGSVYMNALWRSGSYVNLDALMQYSSGARAVRLTVDKSTLESGCPVLYLTVDNPADQTAVFNCQTYSSWDVDTLWSRPDVTQLKIKLKDANRSINEVSFTKNSN